MFKELTVQEWLLEIEKGLEFRRKYGDEKDWSTLEDLWTNTHETVKNNSPNIIMASGDSIISNLSVPYPYMVVSPRSQDTVLNAPIVESVCNLLIETMGIPVETEDVYWSSYLFGRGIYKIGYDSEWGYDPDLDVGGTKQPMGMTLSQFASNKAGTRIEFGNAKPGMPWGKMVLPHDFVVPFGTGRDLQSAEWCCHRVIRHVEDCKADSKFENTRDLQPNMTAEDFMLTYRSSIKPYRMGSVYYSDWGQNRKPQYVELWEIHDRRTGKIYVIATGHNKFLRNEQDLLQIRGLPFVSISFVKNARTFWTTPPAQYLLNAQLELSDISLQGAKLRRSNILKMLVTKDAFDEDELDKLCSARIQSIATVKQGKLDDAVKFLSAPPNLQIYQEQENVRRNVRETVGLGRNQVGELEPSGRHTAFEVKQVADSSAIRMDSRQLSAKRMYVEILRLSLSICEKWWKTPRLVQIMDQNSIPDWVRVTGDKLQGEYGFEMNFTNEGGESLSSRRQMAIQMYPVLNQDPTVDPVKLRQWLVRSMADPNFASVFPPELLAGQINPQQLQQMIANRPQDMNQGVNQVRTQNRLVAG